MKLNIYLYKFIICNKTTATNLIISEMKNGPLLNQSAIKFFKINPKCFLTFIIVFGITFLGYSQKKGGTNDGGKKDIIPVVYCVKDIGNGLYQASFGYENPTNKEVTIDENGSIVKSNHGKRIAKGLNKFKKGSNNKVFTKEFGAHDYVEWTIISNGNTHTVIANANSSKCAVDDGFIFPVIGNGKSIELDGNEIDSYCQDITGEIPSDLIFQINGSKVLIEVIPKENQMEALISLLLGSPFNIPTSDFLLSPNIYSNLAAVDLYFEKETLCLLKDYPDIINFARPVFPSYNNSGGVISQGDAA